LKLSKPLIEDWQRGFSTEPMGILKHYDHDAKTSVEVGNSPGWAMAELLKKKE